MLARLASCSLTLLFAATAPAQVAAAASALGGGGTVDDAGKDAFGFPSPLLSMADRRAFAVGNSLFRSNWVTAVSSAEGLDGLGPLFNARSCSSCHFKDGRSRPPAAGEPDRQGLLLRIGVRTTNGPDRPHPHYGGQVQDDAILGVRAEARVDIVPRMLAGRYGDGTEFELLAPEYRLLDAAYGPLGDDAVLGPRVAPQLIGLGLLEAIPDGVIRALADPDDRDRDGISGRAHLLADARGERTLLGRFGWKATQPTVLTQTAAAFVNDIGITSPLFPDEAITDEQRAQLHFASGGTPEIDAHKLDRVVFYTRTLAVPAQRTPDAPLVAAGRARFAEFGCAQCHVPTFATGAVDFHPAFAGQTIHPYTDLLLHDLGPELADGKHDGDAQPSEWRTAPLWGIGLVPIVNGHSRYLHDGRARDLAEAVLWHAGEAVAAKERFRTAPRTQRDELLAFLQSL